MIYLAFMNDRSRGPVGGDDDLSGSTFRLAIGAAVVVAILLSLLGIDRPVWLDEATSVRIARLDTISEMQSYFRWDVHPPLHILLLDLWLRIYDSDRFLRLFSMLLALPSLLVTAYWLRPVSRSGAVVATWLLAVSPLFLRFTLEFRAYGMLITLSVLAMLAAHRIAECRSRNANLALLATVLVVAVTAHLGAVFLAVAVGIYLAVEFWQNSENVPVGGLSIVAVAFVASFASIYIGYLNLPARPDSGWWMPPLTPMLFEKTLATFIGFVPQAGNDAVTWPWVAAFLAGCAWLGLAYEPNRHASLASAILGYAGVLVLHSLFANNVFWYRILVPALPLLTAWIGLRIAAYPYARGKRVLVGVAACWVIAMTAAWPARVAEPVEPSLSIANAVRDEWASGDVLAALPFYAIKPPGHYLDAEHWESRVSLSETGKETGPTPRGDDARIADAATVHLVVRAELDEEIPTRLRRIVESISERERPPDSRLHLIVFPAHDLFFVSGVADEDDLVQVVRDVLGEPAAERRGPGFIEAVFELRSGHL